MKTTAIAIDGPAGAGKSSIARRIAKELGFIYVDTGALYRAIGLYGLRKGRNTDSPEQIIPLLDEIKISLKYVGGEQRVILCGEDVSEAIRENPVSMAASNVSAIPEVRDFLMDLQQSIAKENNVVMDGRDIGTVVLPGAQIKIFLTAAPEDRAQRRYNELIKKGYQADYDTVLAEVKQRDFNDMNRDAAPLKKAEDAKLIDTTGNSLEKSVNILINYVKDKLK